MNYLIIKKINYLIFYKIEKLNFLFTNKNINTNLK